MCARARASEYTQNNADSHRHILFIEQKVSWNSGERREGNKLSPPAAGALDFVTRYVFTLERTRHYPKTYRKMSSRRSIRTYLTMHTECREEDSWLSSQRHTVLKVILLKSHLHNIQMVINVNIIYTCTYIRVTHTFVKQMANNMYICDTFSY